ncbi:TssQ family T6SS-associated lipoprotein [Massilia agilis]|uniref:TssQ family T6SS-associated lipoprotein n=1 Tax=Massilia agilis TaxID=1811226 RepID=A0ABT2D691_9BURK|nr:TssQ family T6SS-associated lipoprotein [Massilia agilis]MCS0806832.1 TssQ family T6SS-associated lipoprotein [Massilia agilis]
MRIIFLPTLLAASLLAGCADMPDLFGSTPAQPHPRAESLSATREPAALREGIHLYNEGDFNGAIKRLSSREIANGSVNARVTALKYTAFSYCVTSRPTQCQRAFERAIRLDPKFDLEPGEHGHPLWGPVFAKAKNGR